MSCTDRAVSFPAAPVLNFLGENRAVAPSVLTSSQVYAGQLRESACTANGGQAKAPEQPKAMADAISTFAKRLFHKHTHAAPCRAGGEAEFLASPPRLGPLPWEADMAGAAKAP